MSADASREAFEAWHADRAKRISKEIDDLAARWITEGTNDSPATKREALLYVMGGVDGTGWDAWQASRKQALADAIQVAQPEDAYQDVWFEAKTDAVNKIKELMK